MVPFKIKQLETFLWVATLGSFRKAAERLNTTQPAVSSRIAGLEEALGVKLFERQSSTVKLTPKGHQLLPAVKRVLRMADKLQMAAHPDAGAGGVLRLGISETIVQTWLADFLREFQAAFPLIETDLLIDSTANLRDELIAQRIDLAMLMGPVLEFRIENVELPSFPLAWVCAPHLKLAGPGKLTLCQLTHFPIISYGRTTRAYNEIYRKLSAEFDEPPRLFPASSLAASIKMALDGIGIASLPRDLVRDYVTAGELRVIDCDWHPSDLQFTASYPVEPAHPAAERAAKLALRAAETHAARQNPAAIIRGPAVPAFARKFMTG